MEYEHQINWTNLRVDGFFRTHADDHLPTRRFSLVDTDLTTSLSKETPTEGSEAFEPMKGSHLMTRAIAK